MTSSLFFFCDDWTQWPTPIRPIALGLFSASLIFFSYPIGLCSSQYGPMRRGMDVSVKALAHYARTSFGVASLDQRELLPCRACFRVPFNVSSTCARVDDARRTWPAMPHAKGQVRDSSCRSVRAFVDRNSFLLVVGPVFFNGQAIFIREPPASVNIRLRGSVGCRRVHGDRRS